MRCPDLANEFVNPANGISWPR